MQQQSKQQCCHTKEKGGSHIKQNSMKKLVVIFAFVIPMTSNIVGQITDSTNVIQISYDSDSDGQKYVLITEQQVKARKYYDKGYKLVGNHEFSKALKPLKKAIEIDTSGNCGTGKDGMAYSELGYAYTRMNDFDSALKYLNIAIEINKLLPEAYLTKSVIFVQQGLNELALETLDLLILNIPDYAMAYVQRGFIYNSMEEYLLALLDFTKFLELVRNQAQQQNTKALVDDIIKLIEEIVEKKIK
jgi:tetratricopeptide (TPR) repeat protein